ncbi:MAG: RluA family pseudouridine synthase [Neisseriales bacterium]|nr:MAG: RluA family pseudouridine synthase [Neisseriales bacterium]
MSSQRKTSVTYSLIHEEYAGQRIDHFLHCLLKNAPKSLIYRFIRTGQVRINKRRTTPDYRLMAGDNIRIPPVDVTQFKVLPCAPRRKNFKIVYEDDALLVIDKPAHVASHGGSGIAFGVIEQLKQARPDAKYLRLAHRLDKDTSGLLMIAKKHAALVRLHDILRNGLSDKHYYALLLGHVLNYQEDITLPLHEGRTSEGKKYVQVNQNGRFARTILTVVKKYHDYTLVDALIKTGRTHQIRVHTQYLGHPVAGDALYGDFNHNRSLARWGLKRMFLHAYRITLPHPISNKSLTMESPLPVDLQKLLDRLEV